MRVVLYAARFPEERLTLAPLGLGYVASYLLAQGGAEVEIVDSVDEAIRLQPNIVGVSSVSQVVDDARSFAQRCREATGCVAVLGGYHVTGLPQALPEEFDYGVLSEGEETFSELVALLSRGRPSPEALERIPGIVYRRDGRVLTTTRRPFIKELDGLPRPLRHRRYSDDSGIFTSRGCPYRCTFCASHGHWGDAFRLRRAESVVSEIEELIEAEHPKEIVILDDLWMANKGRFREIVDRLYAKGIPGKVTFRGFCRSNLIQEEDILLLKRMNYRVIRFGAETGSESLLKRLKGKGISIADHQRVIDLSERHGMPCTASFMFGIPGETERDLKATIRFLLRNRGKLAIAGLYLFNPIPGTALWSELAREGLVSEHLPFGRLRIDMLKSNFPWEDPLYFNERKVPLSVLRRYVEDAIAISRGETPKTHDTEDGFLSRMVRKGTKLVRGRSQARRERRA